MALAAALAVQGTWAQPVPAAAGAPASAASSAAPRLDLRLDADPLLPRRPAQTAEGGRATQSTVLRARELRSRPDLETVAEGDVELRRAGLVLRADRLTYENADDRAIARGQVRITRDGNVYSGPELQLQLQRFEGFFLRPDYFFSRTQAGGSAERIDFLDSSRSVAQNATYSSCRREDYDSADGLGQPDWQLSATRVKLDLDTSTGVAEGATLRFMGVPILGAPTLSFPLSDTRKSGWLPPALNIDSRNGVEFGVPYYWNIAPNRDATITPVIRTKRGPGVDGEFRYLEPDFEGRAQLNLIPHDQVAGRSRYLLDLDHQGRGDVTAPLFGQGLRYSLRALHASDDGYWKDFPRQMPQRQPRLLPLDFQATQTLLAPLPGWQGEAYARVQRWQVLQSADTAGAILAPYERVPQTGVRLSGGLGRGLEVSMEAEVNRFARQDGLASSTLPTGWRAHVLGSVQRTWSGDGWWVRPRASFSSASWRTDQALDAAGTTSANRSLPTFSLDTGWVFERDSLLFGREQRQTLEPRLFYVNTPYRDQHLLPKWDTAARDFNMISLFSENAFSGLDRVSDAHQLTAGLNSRWIDDGTGAETLRLGFGQRFLFRDQRVTPGDITAQGLEPDGEPYTRRFSDMLLEASTSLVPNWKFDGVMQYSPDASRPQRSVIGARWSPGPFRVIGATYRLTHGQTEQLDFGWQWPVYRREGHAAPAPEGGRCGGVLYSVGRVNYSMKDSRIVDSLFGFEYDAGCWIGRVVAERISTGRTEAATRLMLQLELTGLSRLGSNPLKSLKDNIPGYRLLRDERTTPSTTPFHD